MTEPLEGAWLVEQCWKAMPRTAQDWAGHCHQPPCSDLGLCREHLEQMLAREPA